MKSFLNLITLIIISVIFSFRINLVYSQLTPFDHQLTTGVKYGYTLDQPQTNISSIVLGRFDNTASGNGFDNTTVLPKARLHISDFFMPAPPLNFFSPGALFQTTGSYDVENFWSMQTGLTHQSAAEIGRLFTPSGIGNNQFHVQASA